MGQIGKGPVDESAKNCSRNRLQMLEIRSQGMNVFEPAAQVFDEHRFGNRRQRDLSGLGHARNAIGRGFGVQFLVDQQDVALLRLERIEPRPPRPHLQRQVGDQPGLADLAGRDQVCCFPLPQDALDHRFSELGMVEQQLNNAFAGGQDQPCGVRLPALALLLGVAHLMVRLSNPMAFMSPLHR